MKVLLDIKDEKAAFIMEVLKNFKGVKVKPISGYKAEIFEGLIEAVEQVKQTKQDMSKGINAKDLLNEL